MKFAPRKTPFDRFWVAFLLLLAVAWPAGAHAQTPDASAQPNAGPNASVQTVWRLLDYLAVDYPGAIRNGQVVSQAEYGEMIEFSHSIRERMQALPANPDRARLLADAARLEGLIAGKATPADVERSAHGLARALLKAYPVPVAPRTAPDLGASSALFAESCAACHGAGGAGNGPMARGMDPPPIDFTDRARARERSVFALYQVIEQGLEDTPMQGFGYLPNEAKWALAFRAGSFAYPPQLVAEGERLWQSDRSLHQRIPDLETLVVLTPSALAAQIGEARASAVMAYLRANPEAVSRVQDGNSLDLARDRLGQSVAAYRQGQFDQSRDLALAAYLEGFEPVEAILGARDPGLVAEVERAMGELRSAIGRKAPAGDVAARANRLSGLFD
ncbi:MAG: c-type cytochrome, partial [Allosphingosinicella sp.]